MVKPGLFLLLLWAAVACSAVRYDGHRVLKVIPKSEREFRAVQLLQEEAERNYVDIWRRSNGVDQPFMFRVSPADYQTTVDKLLSIPVHFYVAIDDVQAAVEKQRKGASGNTLNAIDFDYGTYHTLDSITQWIEDIDAEYADQVDIIDIAESFEGRKVQGLRIRTGNGTKPGLFYQGGIHAREWITPATVLYITSELLDKYSVRTDVKEILDAFDIYVVPVLNVDGYAFTWSEDRMWRKTRSGDGLFCKGVDANRNFDYQWGNSTGSSGDPCSDTYRGPEAFSEPIVKGLTDFIKNSGVTFKGFVDFHSFSEVWMSPWGYTTNDPSDFNQQEASSNAATEAIKAVHGTQYRHGTIANVLYVANGNSVDWAYGAMGIKYSATPELRDKGQFGFLLPADQIIPCGEETLEGFLAYAKYVLDN